jgi:hypothetical protein
MKWILTIGFTIFTCNQMYCQDSTRIKNLPGTSDSSTTKLNGGALIDTINPGNGNSQQKAAAVSYADADKRIEEMEKEIAALKTEIRKSTDSSLKSSLAGIENRKNTLKAQLKENGDADKREKWEKDYSDLKVKVENLKFRIH